MRRPSREVGCERVLGKGMGWCCRYGSLRRCSWVNFEKERWRYVRTWSSVSRTWVSEFRGGMCLSWRRGVVEIRKLTGDQEG